VDGIDMPTPRSSDPDHGDYVRPLYEGFYDVTFSKYGYYPQSFENVQIRWEQATGLDVALVPMPVEPNLDFESVAIDDSAGNGNGSVDPGENVDLDVTLRNIGIGTATGVSATLSIPGGDPFARLRSTGGFRPVASSAYPDIPDQSTGSCLTPYTLEVDPATPELYAVPLTLDITADGGLVDTDSFFILVAANLFQDDMEGGEGQWTHFAGEGVDDWSIITEGSSHSPPHCWFASDVGSIKDDYLLTVPFDLNRLAELTFWHRYDMEDGYDGCVIEISVDGGPWNDLGPSITQGGYDSTISTQYQSPIGGREAWSGDSGSSMTEVKVDLTAFHGSDTRIRFRLACDSSVSADGWYVDDVTIRARANPADDFLPR
jgi:hypothetical protein